MNRKEVHPKMKMRYFLKERTLLTQEKEKIVVNERARSQLFIYSVTKIFQEAHNVDCWE